MLNSRLQEVARRALDDSLAGCSVEEFCDGFSVEESLRPVLAHVYTQAQAKLRENSLVRAMQPVLAPLGEIGGQFSSTAQEPPTLAVIPYAHTRSNPLPSPNAHRWRRRRGRPGVCCRRSSSSSSKSSALRRVCSGWSISWPNSPSFQTARAGESPDVHYSRVTSRQHRKLLLVSR